MTRLGASQIPSPLRLSTVRGDAIADYVTEDTRVLACIELSQRAGVDSALAFEKAGPRPQIFFDPSTVHAALLTAGGLCPGINNVIRSIVLELYHRYGVRHISGIRYGYEGLNPETGLPPVELGPDDVKHIHGWGGSELGVGRGAQDVDMMAARLEELGVNVLFTIGGDGTLRGAHQIHEALERRGHKVAVVGVPKTVDNDIAFVDKTFGFDTAIEVARQALTAGHTEALSARNGVGLVRLMGRDAGFITAHAALASNDVNFCLVPELPFVLHGEGGLLHALEERLARRDHALIAVAEGCARQLIGSVVRDASGNASYSSEASDVGPLMRDAIVRHFRERGLPLTLKYIDPSYMIRSVPANASDSRLADSLARHAVHAAMAGKTDLVIGFVNSAFVHVPLTLATSRERRLNLDGELWLAVTSATGQPPLTG